ncbi:hypothetical protein QYE76_044789 [Lolium multiflorum]|uniref:Leucine-rich repeat-containing N-terminal plant-type domain-containing protein n=1 Tax=Lolium multiflorum TaxID=4521 RepID=A0AAD8WZ68_LOLMU|nr:hypothetical protein QYE76_044789 [Lolium multiflorum]
MSPLLLLLLLAIALPLPPATAQLAPAPASPVKEDKVRCLRGVKQGLKDPDGNLASWTFTNITPGTICEFAGVFCWNRGESLSIALELSGFGLQGAVPSSLQYCRSTTMLDLSNKLPLRADSGGALRLAPLPRQTRPLRQPPLRADPLRARQLPLPQLAQAQRQQALRPDSLSLSRG